MLRTVLMAFFSLAVGYIILVVLIDGVLQDSFPAMIISLLMKFGMSQTEADRVYGTVFMQNKGLFVAVGVVPCTTLIKGQVALDDFGYVKAREDCVTNIPGVFAAGDLRTKPMKQIVTAVADGANAVNSARNYLTKKE